MSKIKKQNQLGMNPSTASNRLVKDLLWDFVKKTGKSSCCKCGEQMSRETFSIEHVTPWLDTENQVKLYFDISNIGYSHIKCNINDRRRNEIVCGTSTAYDRGCRCKPCKQARAIVRRRFYVNSGK